MIKIEEEMLQEIAKNPIILEVLNRVLAQQAKGKEKYGQLVKVDLYDTIGWIDHAMEECADKLIYLECIKQSLLAEMKKPLD